SDFVLAIHFGVSLISFAAVFLLMLLFFEIDKKFDAKSLNINKKHRIEIYALTIYTLIVVYTGALVRHTEANLVCGDWPFCKNTAPVAFGEDSVEQGEQMGHRFAAGILFVWPILFAISVMQQCRTTRAMLCGRTHACNSKCCIRKDRKNK